MAIENKITEMKNKSVSKKKKVIKYKSNANNGSSFLKNIQQVVIDIFNQQVDKRAIFLLLGCYCNDSSFVTNEKYATSEIDYPEDFHRFIWAAIYNISKSKMIKKITPIDIENELINFEKAYSVWKQYNGWKYIEEAIDATKDLIYNIDKYYDDVKKYSILRSASNDLKMDINFLYNPNDENSISLFSQKIKPFT